MSKIANPQIEDGYTKIANELLGQLALLHLSGNEWKLLLCVMRKTWGWNKKQDRISYTQFQKETGMNRAAVARGIKSLVSKMILVSIPRLEGNLYQIQKDYSKWVTSINSKTSLNFDSLLVSKSAKKVVSKLRHTKEINTKEIIQKKYIPITELNDFHFQQIADKYEVPLSFVRSKYDDMVNWAESSGKRKKDWIATLRNFVKRDAIKIKEEYGRSKIGVIKTQ